MSTKTTKKAATRKAQPKKVQPEVTPIPKRARGASKVAEAAAHRPVPAPPMTKVEHRAVTPFGTPDHGKATKSAKRVSGPAIPVVSSIATMTAPDRLKAAKVEHNLLKDWAADGKQGDPPATPVLDWLGENPTGSVQRKAQVRKAKAANGGTSSKRSAGVCTVRFFANGREMAASTQKLLDLAYRYTAGIDSSKPQRIGTADLRALLAKEGVTDPETTEWEVTLSNGQTLSAKLA